MAVSDIDRPNLFQALLTYRPRDERHSNENFLTESLVYFLRTDMALCRSFVKLVSDIRLDSTSAFSSRTQAQDVSCRPDIKIEGNDELGLSFELWVENKWGSSLNEKQLRDYGDNLAERCAKRRCHLAFIAVSPEDVALARTIKWKQNVSLSSHAWKDVRRIVEDRAPAGSLEEEFSQFMKTAGLGGIDALTLTEARECREWMNGRKLSERHGFRRKLMELSNEILRELRLLDEKEYEFFFVSDKGGTVAIRDEYFLVSLGFLHDGDDHCTQFLNPEEPLDICLRLQGNYPTDPGGREKARRLHGPLRQELANRGFSVGPGNWRDNSHTVVLAQMPFPWRDDLSGEEQAAALAPLFDSVFEVVRQFGISRLKRY